MALSYKYGQDNWEAYRTAYPEFYWPLAGSVNEEWFGPLRQLVPALTVAASAFLPKGLIVLQAVNRASTY